MQLLFNFVLTFIIELAIFYIFLRKNYLKTAFYVLLINDLSWPIANLLFGIFPNFYFLIEFGVFITESFLIMLLFEFSYKKAFFLSFVANLVSALAGLIINKI